MSTTYLHDHLARLHREDLIADAKARRLRNTLRSAGRQRRSSSGNRARELIWAARKRLVLPRHDSAEFAD